MLANQGKRLQYSRLPVGGALAPATGTAVVVATVTVDDGWCEDFFFFFFSLPHSHSCCWEPHMLIISLNTSHHLTQQTVALLTDPIHAKREVTHIKPAFHPFFPSQQPSLPPLLMHPRARRRPPPLFFPSNSSQCTVASAHRLGGWISPVSSLL